MECLYQAMTVSGHLNVCKEYLCWPVLFPIRLFNCSDWYFFVFHFFLICVKLLNIVIVTFLIQFCDIYLDRKMASWHFFLTFHVKCPSLFFIPNKCHKIIIQSYKRAVWSWSYGSWIYNYLCNQCITTNVVSLKTHSWRGVLDITLCDKVCH